MKDDRYQNQPKPVKLYRWLRWKPYYFLKATVDIAPTFFDKSKLWDEEEKAYFRRKFLFKLLYNEAESKMKHYYTMDEVFGSEKA